MATDDFLHAPRQQAHGLTAHLAQRPDHSGPAAADRLSGPAALSLGSAGRRPGATSASAPGYCAPAVASAPAKPTDASLPGSSAFTAVSLRSALTYGGVPASSYRTLRDTANRHWVDGVNWIDFAANQVKINKGNRTPD